MSSMVYWIWLAEKHIAAGRRRELFERFGDPKGIFFAEKAELTELGFSGEALALLLDKDLRGDERIVSRCAEGDITIISMQDAAYPERLRNIPDPPCVLYIKGHLPSVDTEAVIAVVGTRKCSPYGSKIARDIGFEIAAKGGMVCTGLAEGVDSRAAEGALMAGGRVIGVLGTAIDEVFPRFNARLFDDVAATGALVSEYPPGFPGNKLAFPMRNRIIAGLSLGVVVPEAPIRSGALITARHALEAGRDVFACPANVDSPGGRGSNNLLREGAIFAENGWDVLREYEDRFPDKISEKGRGNVPDEMHKPEENSPDAEKAEAKPLADEPGKGFFKFRIPIRKARAESSGTPLKAQLSGLTENQLKIVSVINKPSMHVDDIIDLSALPASTVLSELTMLQIKGFVIQEAGKRFTLNIKK